MSEKKKQRGHQKSAHQNVSGSSQPPSRPERDRTLAGAVFPAGGSLRYSTGATYAAGSPPLSEGSIFATPGDTAWQIQSAGKRSDVIPSYYLRSGHKDTHQEAEEAEAEGGWAPRTTEPADRKHGLPPAPEPQPNIAGWRGTHPSVSGAQYPEIKDVGHRSSRHPGPGRGREPVSVPSGTAVLGGGSSAKVTSWDGGSQSFAKQTRPTGADSGSVGLRQERVKEEEEEEEEEGGGREEEEGVGKKLGHWVWRHRGTIMTYITLSTLACLGGMLGTFVMVERQYSEVVVQKVYQRVVSNDSLLGDAMLEKYMKREDAGKRIVNEVIPALKEEAQRINITYVNNTRIEYACLLSAEAQWKRFEEDLKKAEEQLRKEYERKLEEAMEAYRQSFEGKLDQTREHFTAEMSSTKQNFIGELQTNQLAVQQAVDQRISTETQNMNGKIEEISKMTGLREKLLEVKGFLKIDTIGPVLVMMGVVELLLFLCICVLCERNLSRDKVPRAAPQARGANSAAGNPSGRGGCGAALNGGDVVKTRPLIDTNNSNVVSLCFRDADDQLSRRLSRQLLDNCRGPLSLRPFVVNYMEDVPKIPACRAALVFVDPDEREMIVEDERYHIGQGLRRHAIQRLLDSGVEVFIIIFNDKKSVTLPPDQLYNTKLGQVDEHAQLKVLKSQDRVISIKDQFHHQQTTFIVKELNTVFG